MKKACLFSLLILIVCALLIFSACNNDSDDYDGDDITKEPTNNFPTVCETHTWDSGYMQYQPTCGAEGMYVYKCMTCGTTKSEAIPSLGHRYAEEWTRTNTHHWHYAICDCIFSYLKTDYGEHDWIQVNYDAPNCSQYGSILYACSVCRLTRDEKIDPIGHTYSEEWSYGSEYHWHDSTCCTGNRTEKIKHTWDEGVVTTLPTCTENGVRTLSCTVCEAKKEESIRKNGNEHSWSEEVTVTPPTCVERGYTTHTCERCGDTYKDNYTDTVAHTYTDAVTNPTCVTQGYTTHTCTVCSDSYIDSYTNTLEHYYRTQVMSPTCTRQGYTRHFCVNGCKDEYRTDYTDTIPHSYKTVVKAPSCTYGGYTTYTCSVCKYTYNGDYTERTEHDYEIKTFAPTCKSSGYDSYSCKNCTYYFKTNYVDTLPHDYEERIIRLPSCTLYGYSNLFCKNCNDVEYGNETEELGHSYTNLHCIRCNKKEYSYDLDYTLSSDGTYYTVSGMGNCKDTEVIIPTTHNGIPVKKIADSAFEGNTKIQSLIFASGDGEHTIGKRAFFGCSSLTTVKCESILADVGIAAFASCASLERITVSNNNTVYFSKGNCLINSNNGYLIAGCKNSEIPDDGSVLAIEEYAFYGCTGLTEITVPESVIYIFRYSFTGCTSLEAAHFTFYPYWYMMMSKEGVFDREPTLGGTHNFYSNSPKYNANQLRSVGSWNYYKAIVEETEEQ